MFFVRVVLIVLVSVWFAFELVGLIKAIRNRKKSKTIEINNNNKEE